MLDSHLCAEGYPPFDRPRPVKEIEAEHGFRWRMVPAGTVAGQEEAVIGLSWDHWIVVAHTDLADDIAYSLADAFFRDAIRLERQ